MARRKIINHQDGTIIGNGGTEHAVTPKDGSIQMAESGDGMPQTHGTMSDIGIIILGRNGILRGKTSIRQMEVVNNECRLNTYRLL